MDNIPVEKEIMVVFTESLLYGMYLITLAQCLRWQLFADDGRAARAQHNWSMVTITVLIFALTTVYMSVGLFKSTKIVRDAVHDIPSGPPGLVPWTTVVACTVANMTALLADTVLMYRCWLVYGRSKRVVIFPAIMWLGGLICTILQAYWQTVQTGALGSGKWEPVNMTVGPGTILMPFWATTLVLNAYTMFMLMYRIWNATKGSTGSGSSNIRSLQFTLRILAESGFLYFSTTIAHFIVWWTPNNLAIRVASGMNIPAIGIAFNLILTRAAQNRAEEKKAEENARMVGISVIRYADNSAASKGIVHILAETSTTSSSDLEAV
ncbi:hypothetical protein BDZ97DRAFT_1763981 [Flammula alnicola]|nr:hypothetical protein BDZ97DRAFT_1763981 [Flammula alnicola]